MAINAPFGLSLNFPDRWAGRDFGAGPTNLHTYNATPSIAYRINDWLSVGAGVQIQYATEVFTRGLGSNTGPASCHQRQWVGLRLHRWRHFDAYADDYDRHWLALIHRSEIRLHADHESALLPVTTIGSVNTTVKAPDTVSLGIRQRLDPLWTVMATAEWSNWSRIGTSVWTTPSGRCHDQSASR